MQSYIYNGESYDSLNKVLEDALPKFNTGVGNIPLPMLAKAVDWNKVSYPCYIQPKLDGVRCLMVVEFVGPLPDIKFLSRSGKQYTTLDHVKYDVMQRLGTSGDFILDGEIYSNELSFQEITAAVKKQRPESLKLKFQAYDIINDEPQKNRLQTTMELVTTIQSSHVTMVKTLIANEHEYVKAKHDRWVSDGYEGAMIRLWDGHYGQGQRSSHLLKVKEFNETEYQFDHWEFGQREEDLIAVCRSEQGLVKAKMVGTATYKKELYSTWMGKTALITVKHFGFTDDGLPRFPIGKSIRDYE